MLNVSSADLGFSFQSRGRLRRQFGRSYKRRCVVYRVLPGSADGFVLAEILPDLALFMAVSYFDDHYSQFLVGNFLVSVEDLIGHSLYPVLAV